MANPLTSQIVDPRALPPAERERFTEELYATHDRIFAGVSRGSFTAYVVDSPAAYTRIQVFREGTEIVGYAAFHAFEQAVDGRPSLVLRAEAGLLPAYRRCTRFGWFLAREAFMAIVRNPGKPVWGLSCATNPATYRTLARHTDQVWPHWERPTPAHVEQLMGDLAAQFGLRPVDPLRPGVYHVGWQTRQSASEARDWRRCDHPASQLYVQRNPGYAEGHGLLLLIPLTRMGLLRSCARIVAKRIRRLTRPQRMLSPSRVSEATGQ